MRKWYLAASFAKRVQARGIATQLEEALGEGWLLNARWLNDEDEADESVDWIRGESARYWASTDLEQLGKCEVVVWLAGAPSSAGKHAELGFALARGIEVVPISPPWEEEPYREHCIFLALLEPKMNMHDLLERIAATGEIGKRER